MGLETISGADLGSDDGRGRHRSAAPVPRTGNGCPSRPKERPCWIRTARLRGRGGRRWAWSCLPSSLALTQIDPPCAHGNGLSLNLPPIDALPVVLSW